MITKSIRKTGVARGSGTLRKPTALSLLAHIFKSAFTGEVLWITAPGGALLAYLYVNRIPPGNLMVILLSLVVVLAFMRGCKEWQKDLDLYRRSLSDLHNRHTG